MAHEMPDRTKYLKLAADVEAAWREIDETFRRVRDRANSRDPATAAWSAACARFHQACRDLYSPLDLVVETLRLGDRRAVETAIRFLEADPMCYRSGYLKEKIAHYICRPPLDGDQRARLREVALALVERRNTREFAEYCRLAARLDDPALRSALMERLDHPDPKVARRAGWMLDRIEGSGQSRRVSPKRG